jgi:hypothetical protein
MTWINLTDANGSNIFMNMDHVLWFSVSGEDGHAGLVTMISENGQTRGGGLASALGIEAGTLCSNVP